MRTLALALLALALGACGARSILPSPSIGTEPDENNDGGLDADADADAGPDADTGPDADASDEADVITLPDGSTGPCPLSPPAIGTACENAGTIPFICFYVPSNPNAVSQAIECDVAQMWKMGAAPMGPIEGGCSDLICTPSSNVGTIVECIVGDGAECCFCNPDDMNIVNMCGPC
jgi:hypothetical protein